MFLHNTCYIIEDIQSHKKERRRSIFSNLNKLVDYMTSSKQIFIHVEIFAASGAVTMRSQCNLLCKLHHLVWHFQVILGPSFANYIRKLSKMRKAELIRFVFVQIWAYSYFKEALTSSFNPIFTFYGHSRCFSKKMEGISWNDLGFNNSPITIGRKHSRRRIFFQ